MPSTCCCTRQRRFSSWRLLVRLDFAAAASLAAALLFAVHPIHVEAVTSLVGRGEMLAAVLVLLYLHLRFAAGAGLPRALSGCSPARSSATRSRVLTKESAASAPALAFLCLRLRRRGERPRPGLGAAFVRGAAPLRRLGGGARRGLRAARWVLGGFLQARERRDLRAREPPRRRFRPLARVGNACLVLLRYVGRIVLPAPPLRGRVGLVDPARRRRLGPRDRAVDPARRCSRRCSLAPAPALAGRVRVPLLPRWRSCPRRTSLFPIGTIFAERLAYLPAAGLCLAAGARRWRGRMRLAEPARGGLSSPRPCCSLGAHRVRNIGLVERRAPLREPRPRRARERQGPLRPGLHLGGAPAVRRGARGVRRAAEIYRSTGTPGPAKAGAREELGRYDDARRSYEKSLEALPSYENGFFGLGLVLEAEGRDADAPRPTGAGSAEDPDSLPLAFRAATSPPARRSRRAGRVLEARADGPSRIASVAVRIRALAARAGRRRRVPRRALAHPRRSRRGTRALCARGGGRRGARPLLRRGARAGENLPRLAQPARTSSGCARRAGRSAAYARRFRDLCGRCSSVRRPGRSLGYGDSARRRRGSRAGG